MHHQTGRRLAAAVRFDTHFPGGSLAPAGSAADNAA